MTKIVLCLKQLWLDFLPSKFSLVLLPIFLEYDYQTRSPPLRDLKCEIAAPVTEMWLQHEQKC